MIGMGILGPVVALAAWTMVMWLWMYATRIPAMTKAGVDADELAKGDTGKGLDDLLPANVQWKAHNYNHLHEAPTVFYAVAIVLAILGAGDGMNAFLGWIYVGLRIAHSVIHVTANKVMVRFSIFTLSTVIMIVMACAQAAKLF